jgi:hypothetical protein
MFGSKKMVLIGVFWLAVVCTTQAQESSASQPLGTVASNAVTMLPAPYVGAVPASSAPPSGKGLIIAGWVAFGIGILNAAQVPFCYVDDDFWGSKRRCVGISAGVAAAAIGLSVPMLVSGYRRRSEHRRWHDHHGLGALLSDLRIVVHPHRSALSYVRSF